MDEIDRKDNPLTDSTLQRTTEELDEMYKLAKLNPSDLINLTQILYTSDKINESANLRLLELDEELLEAIKSGESLSFRGDKGEYVTLCTHNRTYNVREAETSNSLLLVPSLKISKDIKDSKSSGKLIERQEIRGIFHNYYEVQECKPKLSKLSLILDESSFKGPEYEGLVDKETVYDWNRLRSRIQASDEELRKALNQYLIVEMNGYYRLISFEFEVKALTKMIDLIDQNSWKADEVDKEESLEDLKELIPIPIFNALFEKYAEPSGKENKNQKPLYRYSEERVCKILAKVLLAVSPVTEYTGFIEAWNMTMTGQMSPREEYLYGVAIVRWNRRLNRKEVVSFPEENLPDSIDKRFEELFKVKEKWTLEEITAYILNLATDKLDVNALLTKYARSSVKNGIKYYSSKHGK